VSGQYKQYRRERERDRKKREGERKRNENICSIYNHPFSSRLQAAERANIPRRCKEICESRPVVQELMGLPGRAGRQAGRQADSPPTAVMGKYYQKVRAGAGTAAAAAEWKNEIDFMRMK
jgi:hypothetical protein